jgi:plasmid stability protein
MFEAPLTFAEALAELNSRLDTPTALKYRQIVAAWDADMRARAFFSARVTEAGVLSELHNKVQAVLDGKMTDKQAVALLRDYFVGSGADPLARMGFAPPHNGPEKIGARSIDELASLPRLELIIETNLRMAQECGHYQSWAESASYWRYGIWRCGWAKEHREEHLAREGRVYAFDHPIWTQSPPGGEFNCHCYREIASEEDIQRLGLTPEPLHSPFTPSSLGFDPSRSLRQPPPFGRRVRPEYADSAQRKIDAFTKGEEPATPVPAPPAPAPTPTEQHAAKRQAQWQQAYEKRKQAWEDDFVAVGMDKAAAKELARLYTPEAAKIGKPPTIVFDDVFTGAYLSKDATELVVGGSLSVKKTLIALRKAVKNLPHKLKRGKQWRAARRKRSEEEARMIGAKLITGKNTRKEDLEATNPNWGSGREWQVNCQRCVTAYEARRRGIDVTALPCMDISTDFLANNKGWLRAYKNPKEIRCSMNTYANTVRTTKENIRNAIENMPDGARCVVRVQYKDMGHVFVAERIDGKTYFFDPQPNGRPAQQNAKENFIGMKPWHAYVYRVDNLKFTDTVRMCVKRR